MTIRNRIADWISGGTISKQDADIASITNKWRVCVERMENLEFNSQMAVDQVEEDEAHAIFERQELARECRILRIQSDQAAIRGAALRRIAAMETPGANATVKRMAQAAREALK